MSVESELVSQLTSFAGLAALVADRVYRSLPQEPVLPAVTYLRVDTAVENDHAGFDGLIHPRFQVECWALTDLVALDVAEQVMAAAQDWCSKGKPMLWQDQKDDPDETAETGRHRIIQEYIIWHKAS